ncbi:MAG: hypothetical protein ABFS03_11220 [Chloroflexota bacterium]
MAKSENFRQSLKSLVDFGLKLDELLKTNKLPHDCISAPVIDVGRRNNAVMLSFSQAGLRATVGKFVETGTKNEDGSPRNKCVSPQKFSFDVQELVDLAKSLPLMAKIAPALQVLVKFFNLNFVKFCQILLTYF